MNSPRSATRVRQAIIALGLLVLGACDPASRSASSGSTPAERLSAALAAVDGALGRGDLSGAARAQHEAYAAAVASAGWEGLVAVAGTALRMGAMTGLRREAEDRARGLYRFALFRARALGSLDGALRVAEASKALGDDATVDQALAVAEQLARAAPDRGVAERVAAARQILTRPAAPQSTGRAR